METRMSTAARAPDVLWIAGAGHSGSTLLGLMLGSHSRAFYAGEAKKASFLHDETKPMRKRTCKLCGTACPVWGDFPQVPMSSLYETLAAKTRASLIVDSTKGLDWLHARIEEVAAGEGKGTLVFLSRDGRAVVCSDFASIRSAALRT